jgi:hypothetical protein
MRFKIDIENTLDAQNRVRVSIQLYALFPVTFVAVADPGLAINELHSFGAVLIRNL